MSRLAFVNSANLIAKSGVIVPMDTSLDLRVVRIMERVRLDPSQSLPDLAKLVNLSSSRLSHLFKQETGVSLTSYIDEQRMERAIDLLQSTEMRIKEITYLVGFQHEASFDRAFAKKFRCTPTDYRKQKRYFIRSAQS